MRRLPLFFVLDVSESMLGEPLYQLEEGLERIVTTLRTDPHALETAYLSVIAFAGQVRRLCPLTELTAFSVPQLPIGGGTSLGKALSFLMDEFDTQVRKGSPEQKGDWKPIVFLITDGTPTDHVDRAVERWRRHYAARATLIAISIGHKADLSVLQQLTPADKVLTLETASPESFRKFIAWVTQSIQVRSRSVGDPVQEERLPEADSSILKKLNLDKPIERVDETAAFFVSKCQKSKLPYVSRYEPAHQEVEFGDARMAATIYRLVGCYPVRATYFEMSSEQPNVAVVDSSQLLGQPGCPHCGNPIGFAMCGCGNTLCISGPGEQTCPWCEKTAMFGRAPDDAPSIELTRARG